MNKEDSKELLKNIDVDMPNREVASIEIGTDKDNIIIVGKNDSKVKEILNNTDTIPYINVPSPKDFIQESHINVGSGQFINVGDEFKNTAPLSEEILMTNPPQYSFSDVLNQSIEDYILIPHTIYNIIVSDDLEEYEKIVYAVSEKICKYLCSHLQLAVLNNSRGIIEYIATTINQTYSSLKKKPPIYMVRPPYDEDHLKEYHTFGMILRTLKEAKFHVIVTEKVEEV